MAALLDGVRAVAFDLDGTLVDSAPDIAAAANATLESLGMSRVAEANVALAIGDGVDMLVERAMTESAGATPAPERLAAGIARFRDEYAKRAWVASRIYPGVSEGLDALQARGLPLACITNKASRFTAEVLERSGLARRFAFACCADTPERRKPRPDLLHEACARLNIDAAELLFVGDSALDVAAARAAGSPVVAVDYGYRQGKPVEALGADAVIASLVQLAF
jgi:phosphoglycolate phosphatase